MKRLFLIGCLAFTCIFGGIDNSAKADDDIAWEVVHPFRFFKYDSDFEIHRLAYEDLKSRTPPHTPTILEMDGLLNRPGWWDQELKAEIIARYENPSLNSPRKILAALRKIEIEKQQRPKGAPELASQGSASVSREYDFRRMGWASLLFPFHQSENEIGKGELIDAANVGVCWNRSGQRHNNCADYVKPAFHTVSLRPARTDLPGDTQCTWSVDDGSGAKFVGPPEGTTLSAPCNRAVRLHVPFEREANIKLSASGSTYQQAVKVRDVLAVSLGDSFSSGEGNPDVPAKMRWTSATDLDPITISGADEFAVPGFIPLRKRGGDYFAAQWVDRACHRSVYSYPVRAAIQMALNDKHRSVTFLGYACSGAEVNEGLLAPFMGPEFASNKDDMQPYKQAQIPLMLSELCEQYAGGGVRDEPISASEEDRLIKSGLYKFGKPRGATAAFDPAYRCGGTNAPGFKRPIDVMMLSIGGNDAGFSKWIKAAITSYAGGSTDAFLPILKGDAECAANSGSCNEMTGRWRRLEARYALLREFLSERVWFRKPGQQPVLVYTYPGSGTDKNGYCASGNSGMTVLDLPSICLRVKDKGITKLPFIEAFVNTKLNPRIASFARPEGAAKPWLVVNDADDYISGFKERSFCATDVDQAGAQPEPQNKCYTRREILTLHRTGKIPVFDAHNENETLHVPRTLGTWQPFNPVLDFSPYHPRRRWMRTINDVYLLINQQSAETRDTDVVTLLGFAQSAVYGAFHPTAEAHARVADSFAKGAETVLREP
jgi:hypothetical protein